MELNMFNVPTSTKMTSKNCSFTIRLTNVLFACVLLSSVMTCARAAPSPKVLHFPPQSHVPHSSYDDNPCGVDNIVPTPLRHTGAANFMKVPKHLERHLSDTLRDFNHLNKSKISIQYKDSMNMTKHFVNKFLPKNQLAEFKKFKNSKLGSSLSPKDMIEHILVDLRGKLKFFGKAFHELSIKPFSTQSASFSISERTTILKVLGAKLRALSCEVETFINATNAVVPPGNAQNFAKVGSNWPKNPDTTAIMTLDMSTFALYKNFLQDWIQVQKEVQSQKRPTRTIRKRPARPAQGKKRPIRSTKGTKAPNSKSAKKQMG